MSIQQLKKSSYTFEEYLALEEQATEKHEYHNGDIFAMSGGTWNHSVISSNVGTALNNAIDKADKACTVANSDIKIFLEAYNHGVYPDAMAICEEEKYHTDNQTVITNPMLIIEVLSKSTKNYDKGEKFEKYRSLPSFKEYMLVWQTIPKVQTWYKEEESLWRISSAFGLDNSIFLYSIGCDIALKDIYKKIKKLGNQEIKEAF